ncbi:hypothetical protein STENM327S_01640 [Streptomyces tendae]
MGVGMIAIVPEESTDVALTALADRGVDASVARADHYRRHGTGAALVGDYAVRAAADATGAAGSTQPGR